MKYMAAASFEILNDEAKAAVGAPIAHGSRFAAPFALPIGARTSVRTGCSNAGPAQAAGARLQVSFAEAAHGGCRTPLATLSRVLHALSTRRPRVAACHSRLEPTRGYLGPCLRRLDRSFTSTLWTLALCPETKVWSPFGHSQRSRVRFPTEMAQFGYEHHRPEHYWIVLLEVL
jgi:hypothetical protein